MENIKLYEVNADYIDYLSAYAPHLFQNKKLGQKNERKYIGIVFQINGLDYFAPLSSFKQKHHRYSYNDSNFRFLHFTINLPSVLLYQYLIFMSTTK